jgi:hypothetical protein
MIRGWAGPAAGSPPRCTWPASEARNRCRCWSPLGSGATARSSSPCSNASVFPGLARARARPRRVLADKAYGSRGNRSYLRRRGIRCTIPDKADQIRNRKKKGRAGGRPPCTASILITWCLTWGLCDQLRRLVVLVDHATEDLSPSDRQVQRRAGLAVLVGRSLLAGLVRAVAVVMAGVLAED